MKKWTDIRVARHLKRAFGSYELNHQVHRNKAEKTATLLLSELDALAAQRCDIGCRAVNTAVSLLCRWNLAPWAEGVRKRFPDVPRDHLSDEILMVGYARRKDAAKVRELIDSRRQVGLPETTASFNLLLKAMAKPDPKGMRAVLQEMADRGLQPDKATAVHALACCEDVASARQLHELNFTDVIGAADVVYSLINIATRVGDHESVERFLAESPLPADVYQLNKLMNAYAVAGELDRCRELLRAMHARRRVAPTAVTYATILKACAEAASDPGDEASELAERVFGEAYRNTCDDAPTLNNHVFTKLMAVYAKTGDARRAGALKDLVARCGVRMTPPMKRYLAEAERRARGGTTP